MGQQAQQGGGEQSSTAGWGRAEWEEAGRVCGAGHKTGGSIGQVSRKMGGGGHTEGRPIT